MAEFYAVTARCHKAKARRAWTLLGLGVVVPGTPQLAHGSLGLGRLGVRLWLALIALALITGVSLLIAPGPVLGVIASPLGLLLAAVLAGGVSLIWLILLANTYLLARPAELSPVSRVVFSLVSAALAVALGWGGVTATRALATAGSSLGQIFSGGGDAGAKAGRYNIVLLGADSGPDRDGLRPDSITVASVDAATGRTVLFSLPRNLESAQFAATSPLRAVYPDGYSCAEAACMLNAIYLAGSQHADLYPAGIDAGAQAMVDAVAGTLGIEINYYAMINMEGFVDLIDAMGGISITVNRRIAIGSTYSGWEEIEYWIEPGTHHFNGTEALWFARSRAQSNDFDRMTRQKCVMSAMLHQLDPMTVASQFTALAAASSNVLSTSIPSDQIARLGELALKARNLPIASIAFTPPLISPGEPDFALIHQLTAAAIAQAEEFDAGGTTPDPDPGTQSAPPEPDGTDETQVSDLEALCTTG